VEVRSVNIGSFAMEYVLSGSEDLPVLAFVHGLSANLQQFKDQLEYFRKDYRVLLISLRGHGGSGYPQPAGREDFTVQKMAEDCEILFDRLEIAAVHWVGNSMGGLVGYELLRRSPQRLLSLATFGTTAELHYGEAVVKLLTLVKDLMIKVKGYEGFARIAGRASSKSVDVQEKIIDMIQSAAPEAVRYAHMNIGDYDYTEILKQAIIPLLLMRCELDREINKSLKSTLLVLQHHLSAEILELPAAGHFANLDRPHEFNLTLHKWLGENSTGV
jgi:3-oxoadipate enol-lactonase